MIRILCGALCLGVLVVAGCNDNPIINPNLFRIDTGESGLQRVQSASDWLAYFKDQLEAQRDRDGAPINDGVFFERGDVEFAGPAPVAADSGQLAPVSDAGGAGAGGDVDFTTTNVQVEGVDESDVVKTDGRYIYMVSGSELRIVEAYPAERLTQTEPATLDLGGFGYGVNEIYLHGDRLIAVHPVEVPYDFPTPEPCPGVPDQPVDEPGILEEPARVGALSLAPVFFNRTAVTLVDVSQPLQPRIESSHEFDGSASSTRLIGGVLHLILTQYPSIPYDLDPQTLTIDDIEPFIPKYRVIEDGTELRSGDLVEFRDFMRPVDPDGLGMTTVVSMNIALDKPEFESIAVIADPGIVFATTEALYISDPDFDYSYQYRETLDLHKFSLRGGKATYAASGKVEGRLLNQFSLGEYQGHLCVATTTGQPWAWDGNTSKNHLFVLKEGPANVLETVGSVENLAPGERIYAACFVGDTAFLVTFRQVDPLITIDLQNPEQPRLMGELKVPGFSEYIHVLDEDHLLTLGRAATLEGRVLGLQLSIFDVSDLAVPRLIHSHEIGASGTSSEAEWNHKAFTFNREENLLALPITLYQQIPGQDWGEYTFSGVFVYHVTPDDGFSLRGQISTADDTQFGYPAYWGWTRGLFIEDHIYATTELGIKAAAIEEPGRVLAEIQLQAIEEPPVFFEDFIAIP